MISKQILVHENKLRKTKCKRSEVPEGDGLNDTVK